MEENIIAIIEDLNCTLKQTSLLIAQLSIEDRISKKPQELIDLNNKRKDLENQLITISLKEPLSKSTLNLLHPVISSRLVKEGLKVKLEKLDFSFNENQLKTIIETFITEFDCSANSDEIIKSIEDRTIYQELFDFKGPHVITFDDIRETGAVYKLAIKFKIRLKLLSLAKNLFPKQFEVERFNLCFEEFLWNDSKILAVSDSMYGLVEMKDRPRIEKLEKLKEQESLKFYSDRSDWTYADFITSIENFFKR